MSTGSEAQRPQAGREDRTLLRDQPRKSECVCVCMHIYMGMREKCVPLHACARMWVYVGIHTCACARVIRRTCVLVCMQRCTHPCTVSLCAHLCACACTSVRLCVCACVHMYCRRDVFLLMETEA